jgi:hypothetical protein
VDLPYENVAKERREGRETVEKTRNLRSWEFEEFGDLHLPTFSNPHILKLSVLDRESGPVPWEFVSGTHKDRPSFQRVVYRIVTAGQEETAETASPQRYLLVGFGTTAFHWRSPSGTASARLIAEISNQP